MTQLETLALAGPGTELAWGGCTGLPELGGTPWPVTPECQGKAVTPQALGLPSWRQEACTLAWPLGRAA